MLIICLGTYSSGSTWVFNVVRLLLAKSGKSGSSFYCENATEFVRNINSELKYIVIKSHQIDQDLISTSVFFKAKFIITTRDSRDSVVSLIDRFSTPINKAIQDLSKSLSTISIIPSISEKLLLEYEKNTIGNLSSIYNISRFIGIESSAEIVEQIFTELSSDAVIKKAEELTAKGYDVLDFDPFTHWHPNHISDGLVGKWKKRLNKNDQSVINYALVPLQFTNQKKPLRLKWLPDIFSFYDEKNAQGSRNIECDGNDRYLIYGPFMYLPSGRWEFEFLLDVDASSDGVTLKIDVFVSSHNQETMQLRTVHLSSESQYMTIAYDHVDHFAPIELRIRSMGDGKRCKVKFSGVNLHRVGEIYSRTYRDAKPIKPDVALQKLTDGTR